MRANPTPLDAFEIILEGGYDMYTDGVAKGILCQACVISFEEWLGSEKLVIQYCGWDQLMTWPEDTD